MDRVIKFSLTTAAICALTLACHGAGREVITVGAPNSGTGDTIRTTQIKANTNFFELFNTLTNIGGLTNTSVSATGTTSRIPLFSGSSSLTTSIVSQASTTNVNVHGSLTVSNLTIKAGGTVAAESNISIGDTSNLNQNTNTGNIAIGPNVMTVLDPTAHSNIGIGKNVSAGLTTGYDNTFVGTSSGDGTSARENTGIGKRALNGGGGAMSNNVAIGVSAGASTTGHGNTFAGYQAAGVTTGSGNVVIGNDVSSPSATSDNQITIKNLIYGTGADGTGTTASASGRVGIGTNAPSSRLHVLGDAIVSGDLTRNGTNLQTTLSSLQTQIATAGTGGTVTGSGTANKYPRWSNTTNLQDGLISDDGSTVALTGALITGGTISSGTRVIAADSYPLRWVSGPSIFNGNIGSDTNANLVSIVGGASVSEPASLLMWQTIGADYQRLSITNRSADVGIYTENGGSGAARSLHLGLNRTNSLEIDTSGKVNALSTISAPALVVTNTITLAGTNLQTTLDGLQAVINTKGVGTVTGSGTATYVPILTASGAIGNGILIQSATNVLEMSNGTASNTFDIFSTKTDGSNYEKGFIRSTSTGLSIGQESAGAGTWRTVYFSTGGGVAMTIATNKNVGIGTASPAFLLSVKAGNDNGLIIDNSNEQYSTFQIRRNGAIIGYVMANGNVLEVGGHSSIPLAFLAGGSEQARLLISGNFGFKTTAPDKAVEINLGTSSALRLTYNDANGSAVNYNDFTVDSGGDLTVTPSGGDLILPAAVKLTVGGGTPIAKTLSATATLDFGSILAAQSADLTITVTGAAVGDAVTPGLPAAPDASAVFNMFVSAANTVTVRCFNVGTIAVDPASATYRAVVIGF